MLPPPISRRLGLTGASGAAACSTSVNRSPLARTSIRSPTCGRGQARLRGLVLRAQARLLPLEGRERHLVGRRLLDRAAQLLEKVSDPELLGLDEIETPVELRELDLVFRHAEEIGVDDRQLLLDDRLERRDPGLEDRHVRAGLGIDRAGLVELAVEIGELLLLAAELAVREHPSGLLVEADDARALVAQARLLALDLDQPLLVEGLLVAPEFETVGERIAVAVLELEDGGGVARRARRPDRSPPARRNRACRWPARS